MNTSETRRSRCRGEEAGEEREKQGGRGGLGGDSDGRGWVGWGHGCWVSPVLLDRFPVTVGGKGAHAG